MPDNHITCPPQRGHNNFVPPGDPPARSVTAMVTHDLPAAPIAEPLPLSSFTDRARGFSLATAPLAGVAGLVAALVAIIGWQVPIASLATLLIALAGFAVVWLVAYALHVFVSADGALFAHVILAWAYLKREQKERIKRYGKQ